MQDIEEDPEMRQNIMLFKDEEVIDELEKQLAGLTLDDKTPTAKSPLQDAQEKGSVQVGTEQRKVVTADRKTKQGQVNAKLAEEKRRKNKELFRATLKKQTEGAADDSDEGDEWEDIEEDFPHVKLEELMENLKINDDAMGQDEDY